MCGIARWPRTPQDSEEYDIRMTQGLYHRGPDAHSVRSWPVATLVYTRLSIIGLSPAGKQPIINGLLLPIPPSRLPSREIGPKP
jgi:asparagine synthase (glutamine-hydrolysing)